MTAFQVVVCVLILLGVVAPGWVLALAVSHGIRHPKPDKVSKRHFSYVSLLEALHNDMGGASGDFIISNGPVFIARLRELKNYPEFKDLTLLYLEEINVTGSKKFDDVLRNEIKSVEVHLLGMSND